MDDADKSVIIDRYEGRLEKLGAVPESLGWLKGRQVFRFSFLKDIEGFQPEDSVLDVGCAYGDLAHYLMGLGWKGRYLGVDIVPGLIEVGQQKYPDVDLRVVDIQKEQLKESFDWVFSSGALTSETEGTDSYAHLASMMGLMFSQCRKGMAINLLSPLVDYQSEINFHPEFAKVMEIASGLSRRFTLRHDYMPYEFTLYVYKDDAILEDAAVFEAHAETYELLRNDK